MQPYSFGGALFLFHPLSLSVGIEDALSDRWLFLGQHVAGLRSSVLFPCFGDRTDDATQKLYREPNLTASASIYPADRLGSHPYSRA